MKNRVLTTIALTLLVLSTVSCRSAMQLTATETPVRTNAVNPNMDFIGFKNSSRNTAMLQGFGADVERRNIAFNSQLTYAGGFNLQELALYRAKSRYVVYIDVITHNYMPNDAVKYNGDLEFGAWLVAALSSFTLFPVYVPMFIAASPNVTRLQLTGKYLVCLYDTSKKELVQSWPYEIDIRDDYKGEYYNKKTDRVKVDEYYRQKLYNMLMEGMMNAYDYSLKEQ